MDESEGSLIRSDRAVILLPKEPMSLNANPCAPGSGTNPAWLLDLIGRIMMTHRLPWDYLVVALGTAPGDAVALIDHGCLPHIDHGQTERLRLFANILQRIEHGLGHDGAAIRRAFECPLCVLSGLTPAKMLGGTIEDLWRLRAAIDTIEAPRTKWYRVGH